MSPAASWGVHGVDVTDALLHQLEGLIIGIMEKKMETTIVYLDNRGHTGTENGNCYGMLG